MAFVSTSDVPTGAMVEGSAALELLPRDELLERIRSSVRDVFELDAPAAAHALFGHTTPSHFLLVGAAVQAGALPISTEAIERTIELNGVGVAANLAAFRWGRVAVADPEVFATATAPKSAPRPRHPLPDSPLAGPTRDAAALRVYHLAEYGGDGLVRDYLRVVEEAWQAERRVTDETDFSRAVAVGLHKVLAYKDEYEVARLLTAPAFEAALHADLPDARRVRFLLHPPFLRALGFRRKFSVGPAGRPLLTALARLKFLRGTPFDLFGYARMRRLERELAKEYESLVSELAERLEPESYERAVAAAEAIDLVRGYEEIKLAGVDRYRQRLEELGLRSGAAA